MKLPEITPFQFQGSAQSLRFDPTQIPDPNPYANQHLSAIQESFRNMEAGGLGQLAEEYQGFQDLMALTQTGIKATLQIAEVNKQFQESRADQEFFNLYKEGKLDRQALLARVNAVEQQDAVASEAAFEAAQAGADFDLTEYIRENFSGHGYTRISKQIYKYMMDAHHGAYIQEQLASNDTETVVTDRNGNVKTVKINDATIPPYERRQVVSELDRAFETVPYIAVLSQEVRAASGGFEKRASNINKINQQYEKDYNISMGIEIRNSVGTSLIHDLENGVLTTYQGSLDKISGTRDKENKVLGRGRGRKDIYDKVLNYVSATGNTVVWENLKKVISHTGKPLGVQYAAEFNEYTNKIRDARDGFITDKQRGIKLEMTMDNGAFVSELINGEGMSDAVIQERIQYSREVALTNGLSEDEVGIPGLVKAQAQYSLSGRALAKSRQILNELDAAGKLDTSNELLLNPTLRKEFYERAKKNEEQRMSSRSFATRKTFRKAIADAANAPLELDGTIGGDLGLIAAEIIRDAELKAEAASRIRGVNYDEAFESELSKASADFTQQIKRGSGHRYEKNDSGEFFRFRQQIQNPDPKSEQGLYNNRVANIVTVLRGKSLETAVAENIGTFGTQQSIAKAVATFDSTGRVPPEFQGAALSLGYENGVDMLRAAADAYKIPMKTSKEVFEKRSTISPKERRFIDALIKDDYFNPRSVVLTSNARRRPGFEMEGAPPPPELPAEGEAQPTTQFTQPNFPQAPSGQHRFLVTVGINEGNRTYLGGYTQHYRGHTDPAVSGVAQGRRNVGSVSHGGFTGTPEESDAIWNKKFQDLETKYAPQLKRLGVQPGTQEYEALMFNIADLEVQAPLAVPDFIKKFPTLLQQGLTMQSIGKARADAFINPRTKQLEAAGFGNDYNVLLRDQEARAMTFKELRRGH